MTRKKIMSPEQESWLRKHINDFITAIENKSAPTSFYPAMIKDFREQWPYPEPTEAELETCKANTVEGAKQEFKKKLDQRVKSWFHNHTRSVSANSSSRTVLKMTQTRMLHDWQAYQSLYYATRPEWKQVVDAEWEKYKADWDKEHPGEVKRDKTRFSIMVAFIKEKFANEPPEVQAKVEEHRKKLKDEMVTATLADQNLSYQQAIDKLPHTLKTMGASIMRQTGWNISFLVGGPLPSDNGQIMTYLIHYGQTKDGKSFEKFLGKTDYEAGILVPFDNFLNASFTDEDCMARALYDPSDNDTTKDKESSNAGSDNKDDDTQQTECKYLRTRAENIAKNKAILADLNRQFPMPSPLSKVNLTGEKDKNSGNRDETIISDDGKSKKTITAPSNTSSDISSQVKTPADAQLDKLDLTLTEPFSASGFTKNGVESLPTPLSGPEDDQRLGPLAPDSSSATHSTSMEPISTSGAIADGDKNSLVPPDRAENQSSVLVTFSNHVSVQDETVMAKDFTAAAIIQNHLNTGWGSDSMPAVNNGTVSSVNRTTDEPVAKSTLPNTPTPANNNAMDTDFHDGVDSSAAATKRIPDLAPTSGNLAASSLATTSSSSNNNNNEVDTTTLTSAPWLDKILADLRNSSTRPTWQELITSLIAYESIGPPSGKMNITSRPNEFNAYIKSKKGPRHITNTQQFGNSFMSWWKVLQPNWRVFDNGTYSRAPPQGATWGGLQKGGTSGISTVVVALSWWIKALGNQDDKNAWTTVDDISWVLKAMTGNISEVVKRARPGGEGPDDDQPAAKRRRSKRYQ